MPSPSSEWDEINDGYRCGTTGVFVREVLVSGGGEPEREALDVNVRRNMETASHTYDTIATFTDRRTAWEFANLLTHYFDQHPNDPMTSIDGLISNLPRYGYEVPDDAPELPFVIEDMDAKEALRIKLEPGWIPDSVSELFE